MCQLEYYHIFLEQSIPILMAITKMILTEDRVLQFFLVEMPKMNYSTCPQFIEMCYICRRLERGKDYIPILKQSTPYFQVFFKQNKDDRRQEILHILCSQLRIRSTFLVQFSSKKCTGGILGFILQRSKISCFVITLKNVNTLVAVEDSIQIQFDFL